MKYSFRLEEDAKNLNSAFFKLGISNAAYRNYFYKNLIFINGKEVRSNQKLKKGDLIEVNIEDEVTTPIGKDAKPASLLYEDEFIIAVDKPAGLLTHESKNFCGHTLRDDIALLFKIKNINHPVRFINRLDMDTSGVILVAKCDLAQGFYSKSIRSTAIKEYIAVVKGTLKEKIKVNLAIGRDEIGIKRKLDPNGLDATTIFTPIYTKGEYSIIKAQIQTGRTHQIRVHLLSLGLSIVGDELYGEKSDLIERQALHSLRFRAENIGGGRVDVYSPLSCDIIELIRKIFGDK